MFGFGKKKKKDDSKEIDPKLLSEDAKQKKIKDTTEKELEKEKKRKKEEGPAWGSIILLLISVLIGVVFWVYGMLQNGGLSNLEISFPNQDRETQPENRIRPNDDGVIIFEK